MAEYIRADANLPRETIAPANGQVFTLEEMQKCVQGYIEAIRLTRERVMYVNEDGTRKALPLNTRATAKLWEYAPQHRGRTYIVGDVLVASLAETGDAKKCAVCEKAEGPFISVEVSDGEDASTQWLAVCGDECLQRVIQSWKQICEIVRP
jgi:hypothetical protein